MRRYEAFRWAAEVSERLQSHPIGRERGRRRDRHQGGQRRLPAAAQRIENSAILGGELGSHHDPHLSEGIAARVPM